MAKVNIGTTPPQISPPQPTMQPASPPSPAIGESSGASSNSSPSDAPSHFDELLTPQPGGDLGGAVAPAMLGKEEFHALFVMGFNCVGSVTKLNSLKISDEKGNVSAAQEAAGALYDTIIDIPSLHFMLQPGGVWVPRIMAIGVFAIPVAQGVSDELRARRRPAASPQKAGNFSTARQATRPAQPREDGEPTPDQAAALAGVGGNA